MSPFHVLAVYFLFLGEQHILKPCWQTTICHSNLATAKTSSKSHYVSMPLSIYSYYGLLWKRLSRLVTTTSKASWGKKEKFCHFLSSGSRGFWEDPCICNPLWKLRLPGKPVTNPLQSYFDHESKGFWESLLNIQQWSLSVCKNRGFWKGLCLLSVNFCLWEQRLLGKSLHQLPLFRQ